MSRPTQPHPRDEATRQLARAERVREILEGATVRAALGQGAFHEYADGGHVVTLCGQRFRARTLDLAIAAAEAAEGED